MNERLVIHALWAGAVMYSVAIIGLALVQMNRATEAHESVAAKLIALFGPIVAVLTLVIVRNGRPPPTTPPKE